MGDFNCPGLLSGVVPHTFAAELSEIITTHPLYNHVQQATRFRGTTTPSILDLILTNEELMVEDLCFDPPLHRSDHVVLSFTYVCYADHLPESGNFRTVTDLQLFQNLVAANSWGFLLSGDIDAAWDTFVTQWHSILNLCSFKKSCRRKNTSFLRSRTKKLIAQRNSAWFKYRHSQSALDWEQYRLLRNHCTYLCRQDKLQHQQYLTIKFTTNPKSLYQFINQKRHVKYGVTSLHGANGITTTTSEAANLLAQHYASLFSNHPSNTPMFNHNVYPDALPTLSCVSFTPHKVMQKISSLRPHSSPGLDGIRPIPLKAVASDISECLAAFFQRCLESAVVPGAWRVGVITPIFKGGSRTEPSNYRPVTLLSVVSKIMESIVADSLIQHLETNRVLIPQQHGFRPGRSCTSNLLIARDQWTRSADAGDGVDVVFLDFSKAFDRIDHDILIGKLHASGLRHPMLSWLHSFLRERSLCVRVRDRLSSLFPVTRGVPQGSVLGPRLFLLFINDIGQGITSPFLLFADDIKIWRAQESLSDVNTLQADLNRLMDWSIRNSLPFNPTKCSVLSLYHQSSGVYKLGPVSIKRVLLEKDLGVIIQSDLGCSLQCTKAAAAANKQLGLLRRALGSFDASVFPVLLNSFIRPYLEYSVQAWQPWLQKDITLLEQAQRRATKLVGGLEVIPYEERLRRLNLFSVAYRLQRGDMILTRQILADPLHPCKDLLPLSRHTKLRGHRSKLSHQQSTLECRRRFFSLRICQQWNALPEEAIEATSDASFKARLDTYLAEKSTST